MTTDLEFYETPQTFLHYLCRETPISGTCFEPCVGSGAVLRASEAVVAEGTDLASVDNRYNDEFVGRQWLTNDIDPQWSSDWHHDSAQAHVWRQVSQNCTIDWTVTNPPFSRALEIATHALQYSRHGVALLLRATIHEVLKTGPRRTWMSEHTPSAILWLPRFGFQRSKTTGLWTTDSTCCCWVVWVHGAREQKIRYAPIWVLDALDAETPAYRARMDALLERRQQPLALG